MRHEGPPPARPMGEIIAEAERAAKVTALQPIFDELQDILTGLSANGRTIDIEAVRVNPDLGKVLKRLLELRNGIHRFIKPPKAG